jgi:hypothetical protein
MRYKIKEYLEKRNKLKEDFLQLWYYWLKMLDWLQIILVKEMEMKRNYVILE